MNIYANKNNRGTSLIDVVVGVSIMLVIFLGIFGILRLSVILVSTIKAATGALALANEQIEFIRSLPYNNVGTQGGIPSGNILQIEVVSLNNINYTRRTLIQYVDAPEDGLGVLDSNAITADYKRAKVELEWDIKGNIKKLFLVSDIVPKGIETLEGGGTLTVNVFDALGIPVQSAEVLVVNSNTNPTISTSVFTNVNGSATFPGAPEASNYEILVTKANFSTAQTYDSTTQNPNPNPAHLSVLESETTTSSFSIDVLSNKTIRTFEPIKVVQFTDLFNDDLKIATSTGTEVVGSKLQLINTESGFVLSTSTAYSNNISDTYLLSWDELRFNDTLPASTNIYYHLYYPDQFSNLILVPDIDLPGNITGFQTSPVNTSNLSTTTYQTLVIGTELKTEDTSVTPSILDWELEYTVGPTPIPNVPFSIRGDKTIGSDSEGLPIYKYDISLQTNSNGVITISSLEWDNYTTSISGVATGYDISESCEPQPRTILPNTTTTTNLFLAPNTTNTLLVSIRNDIGTLVQNASVELLRTGFSETQVTASCGQVFFSGLSEGTIAGGNPYTLEVTLFGYEFEQILDVDVDDVSQLQVGLISQ